MIPLEVVYLLITVGIAGYFVCSKQSNTTSTKKRGWESAKFLFLTLAVGIIFLNGMQKTLSLETGGWEKPAYFCLMIVTGITTVVCLVLALPQKTTETRSK
jgi:hypothetical protein